jgi:geranylgeranyl pyrophosphate synthase
VTAKAAAHADKAKACLKNFPEGEHKAAMMALADLAVARKS